MGNRGERRRKKALIKKRLIDKAIEAYNKNYPGGLYTGCFASPIEDASQLPQKSWYCIRRVLRNEGHSRDRIYRCGQSFCEWCLESLCHKYKRAQAAIEDDWRSWVA